MATHKIKVHIDSKVVTVELKSARKSDGIWRAELMTKALLNQENQPRALVGFYLYPNCMAAVLEPQWVRDLTLDEFIDRVDEVDMDTWTEAAFALNPHWKQTLKNIGELDEESSKKTGTP